LASFEACFRGRGKVLSLRKIFIFAKELPELLSGSLDSGVSNKVVNFSERFPKDVSSELGGVARCCGRIEASIFLFKKYKHISVMEFCIIFVRCNQVYI